MIIIIITLIIIITIITPGHGGVVGQRGVALGRVGHGEGLSVMLTADA